MKISQDGVILIINLYLSKQSIGTESIEWIAQQGLETWKHRQSAKENPKDGYNNCPATRQR